MLKRCAAILFLYYTGYPPSGKGALKLSNLTHTDSMMNEIRELLLNARQRVAVQVNTELLSTYWNVGKIIVEYEQESKDRADYGKQTLKELSKGLTKEFGKGFSVSNLLIKSQELMSALQGGRRRQKQMGSKKELQAVIAVLGLCMLVFGCTKTAESENSKKQVKIGVAVYNEEDVYVSKICGYLEDEIFQYEKDHPGVEIRKKIADARGSQQEQNDQIDQFISLDYDLLLVNIVDRTNAAVIIDKATQADIPVVFFNREPVREDIFRSDQIYYEGSDAKQSAILQADVIADALEKDRSKIDRNGDSVIQFAMLEGESGHQDTLIRSEWVLKELENKKIPTQQIAGSTGNWEKNQANVIVRQWMKEYPNQIEVIISNNDDMALGAWEALEEKGCTEVQVVGIDGIEEVRELVDEDKILGSVLCDTKLHAKALMQFIDVLAFHNGSVEKLNLENERYYMIPLTKVEK